MEKREKYELISKLVRDTARRVTGSKSAWLEYLTTAARVYKYSFREQLLIYAQRPDATACASIEIWNKRMGCRMKRGAKGIALIDENNANQEVRYVFDAADVYKTESGQLPHQWRVIPEYEQEVLVHMEKMYGRNSECGHSFSACIRKLAERTAASYCEDAAEAVQSVSGGSAFEEMPLPEIERIVRETMADSIEYTVLSACGTAGENTGEKISLEHISKFNTLDVLCVLGDIMNRQVRMRMGEIKPAVLSVERDLSNSEQGLLQLNQYKQMGLGNFLISSEMQEQADKTEAAETETDPIDSAAFSIQEAEGRSATVAKQKIERNFIQQQIAGCRADIRVYEQHKAVFSMKIGTKVYTDTEKKEAGTALIEACQGICMQDADDCIDEHSPNADQDVEIGQYMGFRMTARFDSSEKTYLVTLKGELHHTVCIDSDGLRNIRRMNNVLDSMDRQLEDMMLKLSMIEQIELGKEELGKTFEKEQELAGNIQHEDFGEKIGGAKKDLWKDRGLYVNDLDGMNEREAEKFVKKDNIWKKPDYEAMLEDGIPLGVVYFIKKARDGLNASPQYYRRDDTPEKRLARQKEYIRTVRELQSVVSEVRTVEDAMKVYDRFFVENGYLEQVQGWGSGTHYQATENGRENPVITNKLSNALMVRSVGYFERNFTRKAQEEQFGTSKDQKVPKGYAIHFNDGKNTYSKDNDWKPDTYYVTKDYSILQTNFESRDAALKWVQELAKGRSKSGKTRFVPPQLSHVRRTGPDYRSGVEITGQHYLDTFGFRGGEFGNWMNQNDRQASLNMGFEALKDLAAALQVSGKDIAYQGTLAIAFGARGSGNAAAHYEPLRKVINLTKMHGAGSLAHEWWHGLDDYLGTKMGAKGMLSEQPRLYAPFKKLIETMKYKPETPEQAAARTEAQTERTRKNAAGWLDSVVLDSLKRHGNEAQMETYAVLREAFLSGEASVEQISAFKKSVTGRVIPKSERERLEIFEHMLSGIQEQEAPQIGRVETDFYRNSARLGKECEKDGGYWDSNTEMTARAFACYIKDKLPYQSDYLVGHADCAVTFASDKDGKMEVLKAYPEGEERRAINAVFDEIVADLKLQHILTHEETTLPLPAHASPLAENVQKSKEKESVLGKLDSNRKAAFGQLQHFAEEKKHEAVR